MHPQIKRLDGKLAAVNARLDENESRQEELFPTRSLTQELSAEVDFSSLSQSEQAEHERLRGEKEQLIEQRKRLEDELYALTHP